MALASCYQELMKACRCGSLARSIRRLSLSSHGSAVVVAQLVKCSVRARLAPPALANRFGLPERRYSTQQQHGSVDQGGWRSERDGVSGGVVCDGDGTASPDIGGLSGQSSLVGSGGGDGGDDQRTHCLGLPPAETVEELREKHKRLRKTKKYRFVLRPELAELLVDKVWPRGDLHREKAFLIETNPGPGILTRHLLNSGAPGVLAMEREKSFVPGLSSLVPLAGDRLKVAHADFFSMHYHGSKNIRPPVVHIGSVFGDVKLKAWEDDIAVKVIGSLPHTNERTHAYLIASQLLERLSSFKYGRVQFNVFMSEGCYNVISQSTGNMRHYRALSALMQLSCDIELLHKEPQLSFRLPTLSGESSKANFSDKDANLCLVRLTPKRRLFTDYQLSQQQAFIFIYFVRQLLAKRRQQLYSIIEAWAPGHGDIIHEFGYSESTLTGHVTPEDLLRLYMAICTLESFNGAWMGEEVVGYASRALELDLDPVEGYGSLAN